MLEKNNLISVGIDIGTSTSQLIFSKIEFKDSSGYFAVPKIEINNKEILYESKIYFTPLINEESIDFDTLVTIIDDEYKLSGFTKEDIDIGAVIITGESARKSNSTQVVNLLSEYAGDFVVAVAGADLEAVIAAKGAGADIKSKQNRETVVHIDVGGGTSNYCVFRDGDIIDTGCFDIGGRIIKLDSNNKVIYLTPKAQEIIDNHKLNIRLNQYVELSDLNVFVEILTKAIESSLGLIKKDDDASLLVTHKSIKLPLEIDSISFSGGVSEYIYNDYPNEDILKYNDIGILLARSIKNSDLLNSIKINDVLQTVGATVVGAGMHTTSLSGSTIYFDAQNLPLKNVSIIKLSDNETKNCANVVQERVNWYDTTENKEQVAICLSANDIYTFDEITELAENIKKGMEGYLKDNKTLIVILEKDYAKALGFSLRAILNQNIKLISLDSIVVNQGDYIDIGTPVAEDQVLPVIVKTIIFN